MPKGMQADHESANKDHVWESVLLSRGSRPHVEPFLSPARPFRRTRINSGVSNGDALSLVAENLVVGTLGVRPNDKDCLEVERVPTGYGCPATNAALHGILMPKRSHDV